jgi:hypothetical protein
MSKNPNSSLRWVGRLAAAGGVVSLVLGAVFVLPASAAPVPAPPYATSTAVTSSVAAPVSGQGVVFTATVTPAKKSEPTPQGTVVFTITASNSSTVNCDAGNSVSLSGGTAQCSVSGGLLSSLSPYTVSAAYTDTVDSNDLSSSGTHNVTVNPGKTTTVVTSSSNPSTAEQPVTFTAAVNITTPATGTLAGSVTFAGVTCDDGNTVPVSGGLAQCPVSGGLNSGTTTVTASYGSDPNFANSTAAPVHQKVNPSGATVVLTSTPDTCNGNLCTTQSGSPVSFTATASGAYGTPTGDIDFTVIPAGKTPKDGLTCDGGNDVPLSSGQASCSFAAGLPATVYYTVTATLVDPNYQSTSATLYENTTLLSTNTTVAPVKGVTAGVTFPVTATVTPVESSSLSPTGNVEITVCGANDNGGNGCEGAPEQLTNGVATLDVAGGEFPGTYSVSAIYLGDSNFLGSSAKKGTFHVDESPTTITVTSSENPSESGDAVILTASITAPGANSTLVGPPTGSLVYTITDPTGNTYTCEGGNTVSLDNGNTDEDVAQCYLPAGTLTVQSAPGNTNYKVVVSYSSDGDYAGSHVTIYQEVVPVVS